MRELAEQRDPADARAAELDKRLLTYAFGVPFPVAHSLDLFNPADDKNKADRRMVRRGKS
jgi:hypothetical protein